MSNELEKMEHVLGKIGFEERTEGYKTYYHPEKDQWLAYSPDMDIAARGDSIGRCLEELGKKVATKRKARFNARPDTGVSTRAAADALRDKYREEYDGE